MSNVVKRKRKLSHMEFYKKSLDIRELLTRYVMNEKNVPKRYRFIFTIPIIDSIQRLFCAIINANSIYPYNEADLLLRKEYQRQTLVEISYLLQMLDFLITVIPQNKPRIAYIVTLLYEDYNLLKGWKDSSKIYKRNNSEEINQDDIDISEIMQVINEHIENLKDNEEIKEKDVNDKNIIELMSLND